MNYLIYILIFFIGTIFGSFVSESINRIPIKQKIKNSHSYCPQCNHKLNFLDKIPIFSYIFSIGKCRYCKKEIKPNKFLIEIFTGILFLFFAISIKLNLHTLNTSTLIYFLIGIIYLTIILIIAGIDKKYFIINKPLLIIGFICTAIHIIYLYISENPKDIGMYRYVVYLILECFLVLFSVIYLKKKGKDSYTIDILMLAILMIIYTYEAVSIYTVMITLIAIVLQLILQRILKRKRNSKYVKGIKIEHSKIPVGFYMVMANITALLITNYTLFYIQM